jgi:hypothetical protein
MLPVTKNLSSKSKHPEVWDRLNYPSLTPQYPTAWQHMPGRPLLSSQHPPTKQHCRVPLVNASAFAELPCFQLPSAACTSPSSTLLTRLAGSVSTAL